MLPFLTRIVESRASCWSTQVFILLVPVRTNYMVAKIIITFVGRTEIKLLAVSGELLVTSVWLSFKVCHLP